MQVVDGNRVPTITPTGIYGFFGPYRFLSNFHVSPVALDGLIYPSSEHAYMAQKSHDPEVRRLMSQAPTPAAARRLGRTIALREDWDDARLPAMLHVLLCKFKDPELQRLLLATGERYLEETNNWGDRFWGVDGHGQNNLGQLLMLVRRQLAYRVPPQADLFSGQG